MTTTTITNIFTAAAAAIVLVVLVGLCTLTHADQPYRHQQLTITIDGVEETDAQFYHTVEKLASTLTFDTFTSSLSLRNTAVGTAAGATESQLVDDGVEPPPYPFADTHTTNVPSATVTDTETEVDVNATNTTTTTTTTTTTPTTTTTTTITTTITNFTTTPESSCRDRTKRKTVELALAFDSTYCQLYSNNKTNATAAALSAGRRAAKPFSSTTCLRIRVTHVEGHCNEATDPYVRLRKFTGISASLDILTGFQQIWNTNRTHIPRDTAFLLSGFEDGSSALGRAYIGTTCWLEYAYGWVEQGTTAVLAHELGHALDARHTDTGLMVENLSNKRNRNPNGKIDALAQDSIDAIVTYVDTNPRAVCIGVNSETGASPSPTPSPLPRTDVVPPPSPRNGTQQTCADGFAPPRVFGCATGRRLGSVVLPVGRLNVSLSQAYNRVTVRLRLSALQTGAQRPPNGTTVSFRRYGVAVSLTPAQSASEIPQTFRKNFGADAVESRHVVTDLRRPADMRSCCWRTLYVSVVVTVVKRVPRLDGGDEGTGKFRYISAWKFVKFRNWKMRCENPCAQGGGGGGGTLIEQSETQKCAVCAATL